MSPRLLLGLSVLLTLGCARSAADAEAAEAPSLDETSDGEDEESLAREPDPPAPEGEPPVDDPEAEHISFEGPDAEPGPSDQVVAPPQRPPMPSMMTDVLKTGPRR